MDSVTIHEIKRRWPNASASTIARNVDPAYQTPNAYETGHLPPRPKSERLVPNGAIRALSRKAGNPTRRKISVVSFRTRLIDPDNLCPKYFIDSLRYEGLIENDTAKHITLEVRQEKVHTKEEERTEIEIL